MIGNLLERVRGLRLLALVAVAYLYGFVLLNVLPQWNRLVAARGGVEIQSQFGATGRDVQLALEAYDAGLRRAALVFYVLDIPNFLLLALATLALMAFGLRSLGLFRTPWTGVLVLPALGAAADLLENAGLAAALLAGTDHPILNAATAGIITAKLIVAFYLTFPLMLVLVVAGLAALAWRRLRPATSSGRRR